MLLLKRSEVKKGPSEACLVGGWVDIEKKIHFSCYMDQPVEIGWKVEEAHDSQKKM